MVNFGGFFAKLGFSRFFLQIINLSVRISAAAMAGDIIFFRLAGPVGDYTGAHTVIVCVVFFFLLFSRRKREAAMGRSGGHCIF